MSDREKWNERYAAQDETPEPDALVVRAAGARAPGKALDIACGTGRNALYLARSGWSVSGVDISDGAIDKLRRTARAEELPVDAICADLTLPSFLIPPDSFDLICNCRYLQRELFPQLISALRPEGLLVAVIAMVDDDPSVPAMNPAFLLQHGELLSLTAPLAHVYYEEIKAGAGKRRTAKLIARAAPQR